MASLLRASRRGFYRYILSLVENGRDVFLESFLAYWDAAGAYQFGHMPRRAILAGPLGILFLPIFVNARVRHQLVILRELFRHWGIWYGCASLFRCRSVQLYRLVAQLAPYYFGKSGKCSFVLVQFLGTFPGVVQRNVDPEEERRVGPVCDPVLEREVLKIEVDDVNGLVIFLILLNNLWALINVRPLGQNTTYFLLLDWVSVDAYYIERLIRTDHHDADGDIL